MGLAGWPSTSDQPSNSGSGSHDVTSVSRSSSRTPDAAAGDENTTRSASSTDMTSAVKTAVSKARFPLPELTARVNGPS